MAGAAIWWIRRDLRLSDNPALTAAVAAGGPVIPLFIRDPEVDGLATAPAWRYRSNEVAMEVEPPVPCTAPPHIRLP